MRATLLSTAALLGSLLLACGGSSSTPIQTTPTAAPTTTVSSVPTVQPAATVPPAGAPPSATSAPPPPPPPTATPPIAVPTLAGTSIPPSALAVIADLALKVRVAPNDIEIVSIEMTSWPDACLGYPQPGLVCADVVTPGYRVVLAATVGGGRRTYEYHTNLFGSFRSAP